MTPMLRLAPRILGTTSMNEGRPSMPRHAVAPRREALSMTVILRARRGMWIAGAVGPERPAIREIP
jgi:hypothetical protein